MIKLQAQRVMDILKANNLGPCNHPDCDARQPSCATNYVHLKAKAAVEAAMKPVARKPERKARR